MKQDVTFHHEDDESAYPPELIAQAQHNEYYGRMNDPTSSAYLKGACGDEMEFYLVISNDTIEEIRFFTNGCIATRACGSLASQLAKGETVYVALGISPKCIIDRCADLPPDHRHCAILAVSTLYKAIADYLLRP